MGVKHKRSAFLEARNNVVKMERPGCRAILMGQLKLGQLLMLRRKLVNLFTPRRSLPKMTFYPIWT